MEQSDVFVSYRRKDVEFVKQLVQSLNESGRKVWVDWDDIPPGVEGFGDEIQRGIENANAFIAVLSPSYLESEYCLMELREALRLKKRIVPVVHQKFEPLAPPEGIGHINWVYFTPHAGQENTFEQSFPRVIRALEADYAHAREHTRLLTRALEWDKRQRENSYLLKGAEIDQAEGWQVQAAGKNPAPTELQLEYVLNSRKQQRIQQRRITASISILLVLAVIAAVYAVFQANAARISAEIARSNALASAALQPGNEEIAIALALESTRSEHAPESVYKTLARVAYPIGGIRHFMTIDDDDLYVFISPAISPNGEQVVIKNKLYNMVTGELVRTFEKTPGYALTGLFTADGKQVILAGDDEGYNDPSAHPVYLGLYNVETGELLRAFETGIGISQVQLSADGNTLIAFQRGGATWWDIHTGEKLREFTSSPTSVLAFSPDLKWMAEAHSNEVVAFAPRIQWEWSMHRRSQVSPQSELTITNLQTMKVQQSIPGFETSKIKQLRFSNNSKELTIFSQDTTTYLTDLSTVDVESGQFVTWFQGPPPDIVSIRYSPDDSTLLTAGNDQAVILWDAHTGSMIKRQTIHHAFLLFADFTRNGKGVLSMDDSGTVINWDTTLGDFEQKLDVNESMSAITPDGRYLITQAYSGYFELDHLAIRDASTLEEINRLPMTGTNILSFYLADGLENGIVSYTTSAITPEGVTTSFTLHFANLSNGKVQSIQNPGLDSIYDAQFSPDGKELYITYTDADSNHNMGVWNLATQSLRANYIQPFSEELRFALSHDGTRLLIATRQMDVDWNMTAASVQMLDTSNGKVLFTMEGDAPQIIFFTPDGKQFVFANSDPFGEAKSHISVYDSQTGQSLHEYTINVDASSDFHVSPDGKSFVTNFSGSAGGGGGCPTPSVCIIVNSNVEGSTIQWDLATGEQVWRYPSASLTSVFAPDGNRLFNSSYNLLQVWRLDSPQDLIAWACANRYVPQFTDKERERFGIENNTSVCNEIE